jgi:DNA repair protein RecO (recombination protein O)
MEYQTLKTNAIVLKDKEVGETDKLFTLYTQNFGKIEVLGKGIRKIKAKLKGGLQPLNHISLEFVQGKHFFIATDAVLKDDFPTIKKEIKKYRSALYICDILDRLVKGAEKDERIWELLLETINNINQLPITIRYFEWNLLSFLGFEPELYHCVLCQERISQGKFYFSAKEGGIICNKCGMRIAQPSVKTSGYAKGHIRIIDISRDVIKILRLIILRDKEILRKLKIDSIQERELKELSRHYLSWILEEEIFVV